jgi:very-short-patch-repair endonuclease
MTEAEKKLRSRLRGRQIGRQKFRRQAPLEGYIVDFCASKGDWSSRSMAASTPR